MDRHFTTERAELSRCYPGKKWVEKVSKMSDAQVHEVYMSILRRKERSKNDESQKNMGKEHCTEQAG